jgi:hypothetical protein
LLIIGYSYSDDHENKNIISAIQNGATTKVINVNPRIQYKDIFDLIGQTNEYFNENWVISKEST